MAWSDEWWKGRVIDSTESDDRTIAMGSLCPDKSPNLHSCCGYPTGVTQPDRYVNEEWFGLLRVAKKCLHADQLEARWVDGWMDGWMGRRMDG